MKIKLIDFHLINYDFDEETVEGLLEEFEDSLEKMGVTKIKVTNVRQDCSVSLGLYFGKSYAEKQLSYSWYPDHCGTVILSLADDPILLQIAEELAINSNKGLLQYMVNDDGYSDNLNAKRERWVKELGYQEVVDGVNPNTDNNFKLYVKLINQYDV